MFINTSRRGARIGRAAVGVGVLTILGFGQAMAATSVDMELASISTNDIEANGSVNDIAISGNGRYVVFQANSTNLVPQPVTAGQIFMRDRVTGAVTLISRAPNGQAGNAASSAASISHDGTVVAFSSAASNLVAGDTNGKSDIFVRDTKTGAVQRATRAGIQPNGHSMAPSISGDGTRVAFASDASNMLPSADPNKQRDIFHFTRSDSSIRIVSKPSHAGAYANGASGFPSISFNGQKVAFESLATNLTVGDTNGTSDIYVGDFNIAFDRVIHRKLSAATSGLQGNAGSYRPAISANGTRVAYHSVASNLVSGDTNGKVDVFVTVHSSKATSRVSVGPYGLQANGTSSLPSINADGTVVAFRSGATNLTQNDSNGQVVDVFVGTVSTPAQAGKTLVSRGLGQGSANLESSFPSVSADGKQVAFLSRGTDLVAGQQIEYMNDGFIASY